MCLFALASPGDKRDLSYKAAGTWRIRSYLESSWAILTTQNRQEEEEEDWGLPAGARGGSGEV